MFSRKNTFSLPSFVILSMALFAICAATAQAGTPQAPHPGSQVAGPSLSSGHHLKKKGGVTAHGVNKMLGTGRAFRSTSANPGFLGCHTPPAGASFQTCFWGIYRDPQGLPIDWYQEDVRVMTPTTCSNDVWTGTWTCGAYQYRSIGWQWIYTYDHIIYYCAGGGTYRGNCIV
jgi:hypothetical protein